MHIIRRTGILRTALRENIQVLFFVTCRAISFGIVLVHSLEHGQHIGFFRLKTLKFLAAKHGKYLISDGHSYHLMSDRPVNSIVWRALLKTKKILPGILRSKSRSKTWQDHLAISKRDR